LKIHDERHELVSVILFNIYCYRWAQSFINQKIKFFGKEARILLVIDSINLERVRVNDNVLFREIVMAKSKFIS
jgi:hypothetical protein